jgi:hypothetical protein
MLNGASEPNLSFHTCRFIVYISTFAKPMGLYLTLLFSIERIFTKILRLKTNRLLFKNVYLLFIFLGICSIFVIRLIEVLKYIQRNDQSNFESRIISRQDRTNNDTSTDRVLTFAYCYRLMSKETYAKILSFYVVQYWFEYVMLTIIGLILGFIVVYQYCLPYFQRRSLSYLSVNMKFYFSLSSCVISFELILQFLHLIVSAEENNNTDTQVKYLQIMLFVYNFRCIILPLVICLTSCDALKQCLYELLILHSYVNYFDEDDRINTMIDQSETFAKYNNNEHFDM